MASPFTCIVLEWRPTKNPILVLGIQNYGHAFAKALGSDFLGSLRGGGGIPEHILVSLRSFETQELGEVRGCDLQALHGVPLRHTLESWDMHSYMKCMGVRTLPFTMIVVPFRAKSNAPPNAETFSSSNKDEPVEGEMESHNHWVGSLIQIKKSRVLIQQNQMARRIVFRLHKAYGQFSPQLSRLTAHAQNITS
ncbi:hypothetical protein VNO77_03272 [Canavalia gladiata]|uniref:Uncharacterized protein n=1 Tax=Canavalia gladiata TaxID=3824 RepID=A0AAN9N029_CANGL